MPWSELFDADYDRSIVHEILSSEVARQQPALCEELALKVVRMATEDGYAAKVFALASLTCTSTRLSRRLP